MRRLYLTLVASAMIAAGPVQAGDSPYLARFAIPADAGYVGAETCAGCHEEIAAFYAGTAHAADRCRPVPATGATACEACHGPGSLHVAGDGDGFILRGADLRALDEDGRTAMCLQCHGALALHWDGGPHAGSGLGCADCHADQAHFGGRALPARQFRNPSEFCLQCHANQAADFRLPFRHRALEGEVTCGDCHDPHRGFDELAWNGPNAVCLECHAEMAGPFVFEHDGTSGEECTSCHRPHGSSHDKLLIQDGNTVCLQCHYGSGFNADDGWNVGGTAHAGLLGGEARCYDCHIDVHGSNVSPTFRNQ